MKDEIRKGRKNKNRSVSSNEILHIYIYIYRGHRYLCKVIS